MTKDEADIRKIIEDRAKALYAKNVDQLLAHNAPGFVSFDLAPPLRNSGKVEDARAGMTAWFATWKGPITWENRELMVHADGAVAYSTALSHLSGTKTDGAEVALWFRSTNGFRKIDGEWRQTHLHSSVPFAMDGSFRALVDLKP